MYDIFEYVASDLNTPRILVRSFNTLDEAECYIVHPANSHRVLTIAVSK